MSIPNHTSKERLTMKNPDAILADAITTISHRLMDSNEFLVKSHVKMLDTNHALSDAMLEVHDALCAVRDQMASENDAESFNAIIIALSGSMALWAEKVDTIDREIREDYRKSKALKDEMITKVEGLI
jgi:hypothetical protein